MPASSRSLISAVPPNCILTGPIRIANDDGSEVSVTAQIPLVSLLGPDLDARFVALCQLLVKKGVISETELAEALKKTEKP